MLHVLAMSASAILALGLGGCGRDREHPTPSGNDSSPRGHVGAPAEPRTDLPDPMPERLEIELRRRANNGDDTVLKLTPNGARYGLAHGNARVALRFALPPNSLEPVYETLRTHSFDHIETVPTDQVTPNGSSLRVSAGGRYSASTLGRNAPRPEQAEAYASCVAAAEGLLPAERGETIVHVRWDESVGDRGVALDIEVGNDFAGLHRQAGLLPNVDLHLLRPRSIGFLLRQGTPTTSTSHTVSAERDLGIELVYDAEKDEVVLRPVTEP